MGLVQFRGEYQEMLYSLKGHVHCYVGLLRNMLPLCSLGLLPGKCAGTVRKGAVSKDLLPSPENPLSDNETHYFAQMISALLSMFSDTARNHQMAKQNDSLKGTHKQHGNMHAAKLLLTSKLDGGVWQISQ